MSSLLQSCEIPTQAGLRHRMYGTAEDHRLLLCQEPPALRHHHKDRLKLDRQRPLPAVCPPRPRRLLHPLQAAVSRDNHSLYRMLFITRRPARCATTTPDSGQPGSAAAAASRPAAQLQRRKR